MIFEAGFFLYNFERMPYYTTHRGDKIYYTRRGDAPNLVLLIHGLNESGMIWNDLVDKLPDNCTYIIPDLPGNGNSIAHENFDFNIENQAEIMLGILREFSMKSVCIVGHSLGGYIVLEFASRFPDLVNGIFLLHSTARADDEEKIKNRLRVMEVLRKSRDLYFKAVFQNLFSPARINEFSAEIEWLQKQAESISTETALGMIRAIMHRKNHLSTLKNLNTPKHYFIGTEDQVLMADQLIREAIETNSTYTIAEKCGHMGFFESPDLCIESISNFIQQCYKI